MNLTLIVPVYNTRIEYLERAFRSIRSQRPLIEVVVVDDGSIQEVADYLDSVCIYPHRLRVLHKANGGVSSARNAALDYVETKYVAFMDADDALMEGYVEEAIDLIEATDSDAVFGGYYFEYPGGYRRARPADSVASSERHRVLQGESRDLLVESLFDEEALSRAGIYRMRYVSSCAALFKTSVINGTRFREDLVISEDRMFNYEVVNHCKRVCITDRKWYRYYMNEESASHRVRPCAKRELTATANAFRELLRWDDSYYDECVWRGILECFEQAVTFTTLRKGFYSKFHMLRVTYVRDLQRSEPFQEAFWKANPRYRVQKVICLSGRIGIGLPVLGALALRQAKHAIVRMRFMGIRRARERACG